MSYTLVCTGCSSGLGLKALSLLLRSLPLSSSSTSQRRIFAGHRSPLLGQQVELTELAETKGVVVHWLHLDLTSFSSVRTFASKVLKQATSIDCLLLNAAVWTSGEPRLTSLANGEKWTEEAVVSHLSQYYLARLLLPLLRRPSNSSTSADPTSSPQPRPRIVHTTSTLVSSIPSIDDLLPLLQPTSPTSSTPKLRYAASKLSSLLALSRLSSVAVDAGIDVVAVSPGFVPTTGLSRGSGMVGRWGMRNVMGLMPFATSEEEGARRILRALPLPRTSSASPSSDEITSLLLSRSPSSASTAPSLAILSGPSTAPLKEVLKTLEEFSPAVKAVSSGGKGEERWERLMAKLAPSKEEMDAW